MMWLNVNCWIIAIFASLLLLDTSAAQQQTTNIKCISCDKGDDCLKGVVTTTCEETANCYTRLNASDFTISRGCLKDADLSGCTEPNCFRCNSGGCNNHTICKSCDSTNDAKCAQTDASTLKNVICAKANTKCLTSVLQKKTERGCATEELEKTCTDAKKCKMCTGGACNVGIFPEDRLRCHQCADTSTDCANTQSSSSSAALPCLQYVENDKCYMYGINETHVTRGCISDTSETNKCAKGDDVKCKTCDANNCNDLSYAVNQSLTCIKCTSKDNAQCTAAQAVSAAGSCENKIPYYAEGKCYTRTADDGVLTRGCFYDLSATDQAACGASSEKCTTCTKDNGCNNLAQVVNFTCIRCRSDEDPKCRWEANKLPGEKCRNAVQTEADKKCFWGTWQTDLVIRGCLIDLHPRDQYLCNDTHQAGCQTCSTANCNTKSGAANFLLSNGLLAFIGLIMWRLR